MKKILILLFTATLAMLSASGAFAANLEIDSAGNTSVQGNLSASGTISGDGSGLSNVDAASLGGLPYSYYILQGLSDSITNGMIGSGAVTSDKVAVSAIYPDSLSFYSKVIIVAPSGGDFTSPVDALNSITGSSSTNPYLVKIMPGIYDIGSNSVNMKSYVDIEGSGQSVTIIKGNVDSETAGVVNGATAGRPGPPPVANLRFLTVENYGSGSWGIAVKGARIGMRHVNAESTGSAVNKAAVYLYPSYGSSSWSSSVSMETVRLVVTGSGSTNCYGIYHNNPYTDPTSTFSLREGSLTVSCPSPAINYGVYNNAPYSDSGPRVRASEITVSNGATNYGFYYNGSGDPEQLHSSVSGAVTADGAGTLYIAKSRLDDAVIPGTGTLKCIGAYNSTFDALGTNCQ